MFESSFDGLYTHKLTQTHNVSVIWSTAHWRGVPGLFAVTPSSLSGSRVALSALLYRPRLQSYT